MKELKVAIQAAEEGGKVTDIEGKDTIYSGSCVATNGKLHDAVLEVLKG